MSDNAFDDRVEHAIERFRPTNIKSEWDALDRYSKGKRLQKLGDDIYAWLLASAFILIFGGLLLGISQIAWVAYAFPPKPSERLSLWVPISVDVAELVLLGPAMLKMVGNKLRTDSFFKAE